MNALITIGCLFLVAAACWSLYRRATNKRGCNQPPAHPLTTALGHLQGGRSMITALRVRPEDAVNVLDPKMQEALDNLEREVERRQAKESPDSLRKIERVPLQPTALDDSFADWRRERLLREDKRRIEQVPSKEDTDRVRAANERIQQAAWQKRYIEREDLMRMSDEELRSLKPLHPEVKRRRKTEMDRRSRARRRQAASLGWDANGSPCE